ncbi:protein kinase [Nocardia sp. NPDC049526]|uniref:protein kinase domain-containing protein n=1 Tax=Nocardia sp. NPDC049526 TaxID=3364316 RepID=UPI0037997131
MVESDPFKTQRDVSVDVVTELRAAGFEDAEEIERGGFAEVFRCTQPAVGRTVAVKVLTGELHENRKRFFREQHAMGRLTGHPNIVDMLEVGETGSGHPYLVMPYYARGSLDARLRRDGPLSLAEVLHLGVKIAGALETSHQAQVLHRDIKPGNILLTDYGEPALTDFGIAHITGGFETATGTITGSPAFTAPEVLGGDAPSRASDLYGLGATLFCALTGHAAFERRSGEQVVAQFLRITQQPIPDLRERGIPEDVCAVIEAAMSREPQDRPTAVALGEQLRQVERNHGFAVDEMALRAEPRAEHASVVTSARSAVPNLPLELTSFVDRRTQVAEVKNLLAGSRLVTLTGIGGVGKSRLALRVAHKLKQDFTDGVWLVELSDLRDPTLVVDVVAATLGLRNQSARPMLEALVEFLSTHNLLLMLDNCEHMIETVADLAESLLRACPEVRILATSRESLGVGGESVFAVPPLGIPAPDSDLSVRNLARYDAVALFTERAAAAVPGFAPTEDNKLAMAGICARLDGLPLAIELAAARLRTMSPAQILTRLDDRYALLTRGSRGAPMRQQTLRWCIGWSYDLCTPVEQRLWDQLSVFAGGFELDAAEQVCGTDLTEAELLDALGALVDKSILIREETDGPVRFRMLETVQEYGRDSATVGGRYPEYVRRHRDWCVRLAFDAHAEWIGPHQLQWVARLERELPNLRKALESSLSESGEAALRIATDLYMFWTLRGRLSEGRRWCERAARSTDAQPLDRAKARYSACTIAAMQGDPPGAAENVAQLETLAEQTADPLVAALLAHAKGNYCLAGGDDDLARAATLLAGALDTYEASGDLRSQVDARISLGWAYALQGDTPRALACHERNVAITESAGETMLRAWGLWGMGFAEWRSGAPDRAAHLLQEGIRAARLVSDPLVPTACVEILAWIAAGQHHARRAATLLGAADALNRIVGGVTFMFPILIGNHEEFTRDSRKILGARAFEQAHQQGAAMSVDAAMSFALGEQTEDTAPTAGAAGHLTKRERQVADLVARGLPNKAIATRLVISQRTAEGHVEHILSKLGFTSRAQIAAWAAEQPEL